MILEYLKLDAYAENFTVDKKQNSASWNDSELQLFFWKPVLAVVLVRAQIKLVLP
jgi:hypothetical protein